MDIKALLADANLVAPFDASITSIQPDLRVGEVVAYLSESELGVLVDGARGRFYPEDGTRPPFDVQLVRSRILCAEAIGANLCGIAFWRFTGCA